ncbi:MAG: YoaP domain-containing protein [Candidatus Bathyarchaeota archaeon]|nr:YoaP domain-containing protein [Candidatus Bathyarchaeota archaeon]
MNQPKIVTLTPQNYRELGCPCFLNPKQAGHLLKLEWLKERFAEGFTVKHLFLEGQKKPNGFIEYTNGENAWRAVDAAGYLFIHCIWMNPNNVKEKGYGSLLVNDCVADAERQEKLGVAVVTSDGPHMAGKELFLKNGFEVVAQDDRFELLVKQLQKGNLPKFRDWHKQLAQFSGLNIVYSRQCPWVARSIEELTCIAKEKGLELKVTELKTPQEAQNAPSIYATFTLIYDGKIYVDHYVSSTRFQNILKKELKLIN